MITSRAGWRRHAPLDLRRMNKLSSSPETGVMSSILAFERNRGHVFDSRFEALTLPPVEESFESSTRRGIFPPREPKNEDVTLFLFREPKNEDVTLLP